MHEALAAAARRWEAWHGGVRDRPVRPRLSNEEIAARLAPYDLERPRDLKALAEDVADLLKQGSFHPTHPRHFGLFVPSVRPAGIVADALVAAYNSQLGAWWYSPAAAHVERLTLDFFRRRLGLPASAAA